MQMVHAVKYNQPIEENNLDYMKFKWIMSLSMIFKILIT